MRNTQFPSNPNPLDKKLSDMLSFSHDIFNKYSLKPKPNIYNEQPNFNSYNPRNPLTAYTLFAANKNQKKPLTLTLNQQDTTTTSQNNNTSTIKSPRFQRSLKNLKPTNITKVEYLKTVHSSPNISFLRSPKGKLYTKHGFAKILGPKKEICGLLLNSTMTNSGEKIIRKFVRKARSKSKQNKENANDKK